jgi:serine/threonine protein phosphatase PrpC/LysM repeat protein
MVRTKVLRNFDYVTHTDRGRVRDRNEDSLSYFDTINGHVLVVCDGMGGHNAGDVASELAVDSVRDYLNETYCSNPFDAVENAILYANKMVYNFALGNDYLQGMGTTIVLALIRDDKVYFGHVGDSRLYLYRNHILDQMTEDHSVVQQLLKAGLISLTEAKDHPKKHEITRALGLTLAIEPEVSPKAIIPQNDDFLLICTDGLTNLVEVPEIIKILDNPFGINDKATKLINRANRKGGTDNISVILLKFHNLDDQDDTVTETKDRPVMSKIRNLLRNRNFSFFLIFIFILGTTLLMLKDKKKEHKNPDTKVIIANIDIKGDLIVPYKPMEGENLGLLADKFNTDEETIIRLNPNYSGLNAGTHIKIPVSAVWVYKHTDELGIIAKSFGIDIVDILRANDLHDMQPMIGTELIIPLKKIKK